MKQAGGTVVVENPATAMFPSMPGSISPSLVDAKADLDSIGDVLVGLLRVDRVTPTGQPDGPFGLLLDRIRERSGIDFSAYKIGHDRPPTGRPDERHRPSRSPSTRP